MVPKKLHWPTLIWKWTTVVVYWHPQAIPAWNAVLHHKTFSETPPEVDLAINVTLVYILIIAMSTSATADTAILCKLHIAVKIFNLVYILCCPQFTCSFLLRLSFLSLSRLIRFPLPSSVSLCIPENLSRGHSKCYRCILYGLRYWSQFCTDEVEIPYLWTAMHTLKYCNLLYN